MNIPNNPLYQIIAKSNDAIMAENNNLEAITLAYNRHYRESNNYKVTKTETITKIITEEIILPKPVTYSIGDRFVRKESSSTDGAYKICKINHDKVKLINIQSGHAYKFADADKVENENKISQEELNEMFGGHFNLYQLVS